MRVGYNESEGVTHPGPSVIPLQWMAHEDRAERSSPLTTYRPFHRVLRRSGLRTMRGPLE